MLPMSARNLLALGLLAWACASLAGLTHTHTHRQVPPKPTVHMRQAHYHQVTCEASSHIV